MAILLLFNHWPFATMQNVPISIKMAKVGTIIWQILNKQFTKIAQRLSNFCQSGEFSPNLVTLTPMHIRMDFTEGSV